jgi:hypothetical protein
MRRLRLLSLVGLVLAFSTSLAQMALAAENRDKVRLTLLDKCVNDEWKVRKVKDKIVDECKCASAKVARDLSYDQVAAFVDKAPAEPHNDWLEATKACFRSSPG